MHRRALASPSLLILPLAVGCGSSGGQSGDGGLDEGAHSLLADGSPPVDAASEAIVDAGSDGIIDATPPPIDGHTLLAALSSGQLGQLCDWEIAEQGVGYDASYYCGGPETIQNYANQAQCVAANTYGSSCFITVSEFESCVSAVAPSHGCDTNLSCAMDESTCDQLRMRDM